MDSTLSPSEREKTTATFVWDFSTVQQRYPSRVHWEAFILGDSRSSIATNAAPLVFFSFTFQPNLNKDINFFVPFL